MNREITAKDRLYQVIGTCFGLGYAPILPGTCGALLAVLQYILIFNLLPLKSGDNVTLSSQTLALAIAFLFWTAMTIALAPWAEEFFGKKDSGIFVTDEVVGTLLTLLLFRVPEHPYLTLLWAFPLTRIIDIVKIPPAKRLEKLPVGWGVVADDLLGSVYTAALLYLLLYVWPVLFGISATAA
ncbi:MAG: phosphatidylglycerophosphatase A [Pirellulaceae bacterium]